MKRLNFVINVFLVVAMFTAIVPFPSVAHADGGPDWYDHHGDVIWEAAKLISSGGKGATKYVYEQALNLGGGRYRIVQRMLWVKKMPDGRYLRIVFERSRDGRNMWRIVTNYVTRISHPGIYSYAIRGTVKVINPGRRVLARVAAKAVTIGRWYRGLAILSDMSILFIFVPSCNWLVNHPKKAQSWIGLPCMCGKRRICIYHGEVNS